MPRLTFFCIIALAALASPALCHSQTSPATQAPVTPSIGEATRLPPGYIVPPHAPQPLIQLINGGFSVNTNSREQVRDFYNGIHPLLRQRDRVAQSIVITQTPRSDTSYVLRIECRSCFFRNCSRSVLRLCSALPS